MIYLVGIAYHMIFENGTEAAERMKAFRHAELRAFNRKALHVQRFTYITDIGDTFGLSIQYVNPCDIVCNNFIIIQGIATIEETLADYRETVNSLAMEKQIVKLRQKIEIEQKLKQRSVTSIIPVYATYFMSNFSLNIRI